MPSAFEEVIGIVPVAVAAGVAVRTQKAVFPKKKRVLKRRKPISHKVEYVSMPYGKKSLMRERTQEFATSKKDAEQWVKTLKKDPLVLRDTIRIKKLRKMM